MELIPCIDLKNGKCVRLEKGDFRKETVYEEDPVGQAKKMENAGIRSVHIIDLDGAEGAGKNNRDHIRRIKKETDLEIEVGGGIRDFETIEALRDLGIDRVILGTAALEDFSFAEEAARRYGDLIAISVDCDGERIMSRGWKKDTGADLFSYLEKMEEGKIGTLIYTDINRDGMQSGPNLTMLKKIKEVYTGRIIAAGGIASMDDVKALVPLDIYGVITGRAFYEGNITAREIKEFNEVENG